METLCRAQKVSLEKHIVLIANFFFLHKHSFCKFVFTSAKNLKKRKKKRTKNKQTNDGDGIKKRISKFLLPVEIGSLEICKKKGGKKVLYKSFESVPNSFSLYLKIFQYIITNDITSKLLRLCDGLMPLLQRLSGLKKV